MFKRTLSAIAVGAALVAGSMTSAHALVITAGDYKITFDGYNVGTVGYGNTSGIQCNTVASCDATALLPATGTTGDTAGILSVAGITNISNGQTEYIRGTASTLGGVSVGPYLTGIFSGLNDYLAEVLVSGSGARTEALAVGGIFSIFSNTADYDPGVRTSNPGGVNLDALQYAGISGGSLFLSGNFAAGGAVAGNTTASYFTSYSNATSAGNGQGYLDFTGGSALPFFNTNLAANNNGGFNDAFLTVTFDNQNNQAVLAGWDVKSVAQISGGIQNVPEPGSLALISLAMLGLGATTARRRNKKS